MVGSLVQICEDVEGDLLSVIISKYNLFLKDTMFGHILHCQRTHQKYGTNNPSTGLHCIAKLHLWDSNERVDCWYGYH